MILLLVFLAFISCLYIAFFIGYGRGLNYAVNKTIRLLEDQRNRYPSQVSKINGEIKIMKEEFK